MSSTPRTPIDLETSVGSRGLGRRVLVVGAVWTTPLVAVGVAVPAFAASQPCGGEGSFVTDRDGIVTELRFLPSTITATVAYETSGYDADLTPGETGEIHTVPFDPYWDHIKLHHPAGMDQDDTITITVKFSQAVTGLTLTVTDIDKHIDDWQDHVIIHTPDFSSIAASNVIGEGSDSFPFQGKDDGGITASEGNLTLRWGSPQTEVKITHLAADEENESDIGQHIGIGLIGFTC
jgi:hypothetical protein